MKKLSARYTTKFNIKDFPVYIEVWGEMIKTNNKKNASVVPLILIIIFIMLGAVIIILLCSEDIYTFANDNSHNTDIESEANLKNTDDENNINNAYNKVNVPDVVLVPQSETTEEDIEPEMTVVTENEAVITEPTEAMTESSPTPTQLSETDTPPSPTEPPPNPTEPPPVQGAYKYTEVAYPTQMFATAIEIEIADQDNKKIIIEPPPMGRDLSLQAKITPVNINIPNPFEYFKDIIFLGDSVTTGFDLYRNHIKFNGESVAQETTVIAVKSYGIFNATRELSEKSLHPLLNGVQTLPEDIIAEKSGNKIFICLGLNDVGWQSYDTFFNNYAALINRIRAKSPQKTVVIMSVTPLTEEGQKSNLTNEKIMEFNKLLIEFAAYNNIPFIDYAAALRDENNHLYPGLSSDNYCHIIVEAYNRLVEYLLYHSIE